MKSNIKKNQGSFIKIKMKMSYINNKIRRDKYFTLYLNLNSF